MDNIFYKKGYKYQLQRDYAIQTYIFHRKPIITKYIQMNIDGILVIKSGYAWDGPSGPTIDTKTFMRGSLVHDALYQLIRIGKLPENKRNDADLLLKNICLEDGMNRITAWLVYQAVKTCASSAASPKNQKKIIIAP